MNVAAYVALYLAATTLTLCYLQSLHAPSSPLLTYLLHFFNSLNFLICLWEISLGLYIEQIQRTFKTLRRKFNRDELGACVEFFLTPLTLKEAFALKTWHVVWATYALYDPSYQNQESFGFFIDVGNGWSTIVPTLTYTYGSIYGVSDNYIALWGCASLCIFYQMLYGTVIYFLSYIFNKRYAGKGVCEVLGFVGVSNTMWFVFPLLGMYVCEEVLRTQSLAVLRGQ